MSPWTNAAIAVLALAALFVVRRLVGTRTLDLSAFAGALGPLNRIRFAIRRALAFSRGVPVLGNESKDALFTYLEGADRERAEAREAELRRRYRLERLRAHSTCRAYRENLYVLDVLDAQVPAWTRGQQPVLVDVGSKDFVYATALYEYAREEDPSREPSLAGVEIDGHVVYRDLRSRADHAAAHARLAGDGASYHVATFLDYEPPAEASLVTMFFPFVTRFALLQWGLPAGEFRPEELLEHAAAILSDDGLLVVVNHTLEERDALVAMTDAIPAFERLSTATVTSCLVDYFEDVPERTVSVFRRTKRGDGEATAKRPRSAGAAAGADGGKAQRR